MDGTTTGEQSKVQAAKDETKAQVRAVAETAGEQTRHVIADVTDEMKAQVSDQKGRLAQTVRRIGDELDQAAQNSEGMVASIAGQAATTSRDISSWIETHELQDVMTEAEDFARRRPVLFLAGAAALGFLVGRATRSAVSAARDNGARNQTIDLRQQGVGAMGPQGYSMPPAMGDPIQAADPHLTGDVVVDEVLLVERSGPLPQRGYDPESAYPNNDQPVDVGEVLPESGTTLGQGRRAGGPA